MDIGSFLFFHNFSPPHKEFVMRLQLIRLVVTVSSLAQVPPRLRKYSETLDQTDPLPPPRANSEPGADMLVGDPLQGVTLSDFVAEMERNFRFVSAWYEPKVIKTKKGQMTFHNLVFVWSQEDESTAVDRHFRPVRPAIRAEFGEFIAKHQFDVRSWFNNQYRDHSTGEPVPGTRRWDICLNNTRLGQGEPLVFHELAESE